MIAFALEKMGKVYVYSNKNVVMFTRPGTLIGYTNTTVTLKHEGATLTYNDKGLVIARR